MSSAASPSYPPRAIAYYALLIFTVANFVSFLDRNILSLVVGPIEHNLHISDTQMGLLQGFAFNLFYSLMAIPFGYLADRVNRIRMIAFGVAVWTFMTIFTGTADTFWELLFARMGVGIGEATLTPAVVSLVGDYFMPTQRGRALGTFTLANFLGSGTAGILGGAILRGFEGQDQVVFPILGAVAVWQSLFIIVGLPGFLLVFLILTAREPARMAMAANARVTSDASWRAFFRHVATYKWAFVCTLGTSTMVTYTAYTAIPWVPIFLVRNFHYAQGAAGISAGMASLVTGLCGCLITGVVGDYFTKKNRVGGRLRVSAFCWPVVIPGLLIFTESPNAVVALCGFALFQLGNSLSFGSAYAIIQEIVPPQFKGKVTALWYLCNSFGTGLGTLVTALGTDYLYKDPTAIPQAIQTMAAPSVVLGLIFMWCGLRAFDRARHAVHGTVSAQ